MVKGISLLLSWQICAGFLSFPLCVVCVLACERFKTTHHKIRMAVVFFSHSQFLYRDQLLNQRTVQPVTIYLARDYVTTLEKEEGKVFSPSFFFFKSYVSYMYFCTSALCFYSILWSPAFLPFQNARQKKDHNWNKFWNFFYCVMLDTFAGFLIISYMLRDFSSVIVKSEFLRKSLSCSV